MASIVNLELFIENFTRKRSIFCYFENYGTYFTIHAVQKAQVFDYDITSVNILISPFLCSLQLTFHDANETSFASMQCLFQ